jgi:hypothetical protein
MVHNKNDQKKSNGYSLNDGKKSVKTELTVMNGRPSKKS